MVKSNTNIRSKRVKKTSGIPKKVFSSGKDFDTLVLEHRQAEKMMLQKMREDRRIDLDYLRIPFTI